MSQSNKAPVQQGSSLTCNVANKVVSLVSVGELMQERTAETTEFVPGKQSSKKQVSVHQSFVEQDVEQGLAQDLGQGLVQDLRQGLEQGLEQDLQQDQGQELRKAQMLENVPELRKTKTFGNAQVSGREQKLGNTQACGNAQELGNVQAFGNAQAFGNTQELGSAQKLGEQPSVNQLAQRVLALLENNELTLATAESLTGGLVCAHLVSVPGASNALRGGVVAYAAQVKCDVLGVSSELVAERGTVDPEVATQMATGVRQQLSADVGIATTGVAGPGSAEGKPAGTVYIAVAQNSGATWKKLELVGTREEVREQTVIEVFGLLIDLLEKTTLSQGRKKLN